MKLKNKKISIFLYILIGIYLIINILYLYGPIIIIKGSNTIDIEVNSKYIEKGANVLFFTKNLNNDVLITTNLDITKIGTYEVKYSLKYNNKIITSKKTINIVDNTKPTIELKNKENSVACPNGKYYEQGYSAIDNYDGDITDKVLVTKKYNNWIYTVKDSSGNKNKVIRKIIRLDEDAPEITLNGGDYTIFVGSNYEEKGYTAYDNCDGDITDKVIVRGEVNTKAIGKYKLVYEVTDSSDNTTLFEREITVTNKPVFKSNTIYLTFDDGPSYLTASYLDILKEEGVKASFFINDKGRGFDYLLTRMYNEGHAILNHTATHNFYSIYTSSMAFWSDIDKVNALIKNITGKDNKIFRFPGGSSNTISSYNPGIMTKLVIESNEKGYIYVDWTVDSKDAGGASSSTEVYNNVIKYLGYQNVNIVLMHDGKQTTLGALRDIIRYGKNMGFNFEVIDETTPYAHHTVHN